MAVCLVAGTGCKGFVERSPAVRGEAVNWGEASDNYLQFCSLINMQLLLGLIDLFCLFNALSFYETYTIIFGVV